VLKYYKEVLVCLVLAVAVFAVFFQVRNYSLIYFDDYAFMHSASKHALDGAFNFWGAFQKEDTLLYSRPMTMLSHMLSCFLFGHRYGPHHLVSLFFHLVNAILLFWIFRTGTGRIGRSAVLAALFAVHPANVEAVAWLSARVSLVSGFFFLLILLFYIRYTQQPKITKYILIVVCFILGLMAKPEIVYVPFVMMLLDVWPLNRVAMSKEGDNAACTQKTATFLLKEKTPLFVIAVGYGVLTLFLFESTPFYGKVDLVGFVPSWIALAPLSYFLYLVAFFLPQKLNFLQSISSYDLEFFSGVGLAVFLVLVTILAMRLLRARKYFFVGWLWFLSTISISVCVNVSQFDLISYRYAYIPGIGILLIMVWGGYDVIKKIRYSRSVFVGLLIILFPMLMALSWRQTGCWKNMLTFYECGNIYHPVARNFPERIYYNFGNMLFKGGLMEAAAVYYRKALYLSPDNAYVYDKLGLLYSEKGDIPQAEAYYRKALQLRPDFALARNNFANLLVEAGRIDEAVAHYKVALAEASVKYKIYNNLASALAQKGALEEAVVYLEKALRENPDYKTARENLARIIGPQRR
jgi:protein O-mannosyl-transferase